MVKRKGGIVGFHQQLEIIDKLRSREFLMPGLDKKLGPGQVVEKKLSQEEKDIIKNLKSEDLQNMRYDAVWFCNPKRKGRWHV